MKTSSKALILGKDRNVSGGNNWLVTLKGTKRKPLDRQVTEYIDIRKVKTSNKAFILGKDRYVSADIFNSKEEWFSHRSQWDIVG